MQLFTGYLPVIIGLFLFNAQVGTGLPLDTTAEVVRLNANSFNITSVTHGSYSPGKRSEPAYPCNFDPRLSYSYTLFTTEQVAAPNQACFAWVPTATCSLPAGSSWTGSTTDDFQTAVGDLVVKDGWLSSSSVGAWLATFQTGTTAFADRASATLFQWAFLSSNGAFGEIPSIFQGAEGSGEYLFAYNLNQMQVDRQTGKFGWGCQ
jgi:hypothetical protein